jgi:hypothetical protein
MTVTCFLDSVIRYSQLILYRQEIHKRKGQIPIQLIDGIPSINFRVLDILYLVYLYLLDNLLIVNIQFEGS